MIKEWNSLAWNSNILSSNVIVVKESQTIQQVLDSITDASKTNKYLVLVPSGHELEYFDWKPNVEVKFLDNLDERWQLDELEGWDDLSNWEFHGASGIVEDYQGRERIKCELTNTAADIIYKKHLDLRKYQGILFQIQYPNADKNNPASLLFRVYFGDNAGYIFSGNFGSNTGLGVYSRRHFIPFGVDNENYSYINLNKMDWGNVEKLWMIMTHLQSGDVVYLSDFKLVRTFPYPCIFMRTDDSAIAGSLRVESLRELQRRKIPGIWAIIANDILDVTTNNDGYPNSVTLQEFQQNGIISIVNHSYSHPNFKDLDEKDTLFQVEASRYIFERLGLKDALCYWVNPYNSNNIYLDKYLKEFGMSPLGPYKDVPISTELDYEKIPYRFKLLRKGGIFTLLYHDYNVSDSDSYEEWLSKLDELSQFCRFVSLRDIERLMNNSHEKFSPRQTKPTLFQVLDSDFDMYFYHKQLFLDPNGTDRNINVQPYELRPGDPALIVNTGSNGNLIFDPSGLNLSIQPGQSANVIYDGDQWRQI